MHWIAVVTLLALVEYLVIGGLVGQARGRYGIKAPATSGNEIFERYFRVHQNTMEQLVVFLPALWLFGHYVCPGWGALLGLGFVVGRVLYLRGYVENPEHRELGFGIGFVALALLVIGALLGALRAAL